MKLHLGCGEKYLEGYVNIDFPDTEQSIIHTKADVFIESMNALTYPENSIDEIRSHHLFEHFSRAESLKLLARWRSWLKPDGLLVVETPDFAASAAAYLSTFSTRRRFQLARHMFGSQEAGWADHKDAWDKQKYQFVLKKMGFYGVLVRLYGNGVAKHAGQLPKVGKALDRLPEGFRTPFLNIAGNILPERFYQKYGGNKLPNILVMAKKNGAIAFNDEVVAREILSLSLVGKEGEQMLDVWMNDYKKF